MMLLWNQKMPEAGPSFSPGGHGEWLFPVSTCNGTPPATPRPQLLLHHVPLYIIKGDWRHRPNLWGKNPKRYSCSCSSVWWVCNKCPYFGRKLSSACFLQIKSNVQITRTAFTNPLLVVCITSKSKATGAGNIYSHLWIFWTLKCH